MKGALKRSNYQPDFLIGILLTQVDGGPFGSGGNLMTKQEACQYLVDHLTTKEFAQLQEDMQHDRIIAASMEPTDLSVDESGDPEAKMLKIEAKNDVPDTKEDLLQERSVVTRGIAVTT